MGIVYQTSVYIVCTLKLAVSLKRAMMTRAT